MAPVAVVAAAAASGRVEATATREAMMIVLGDSGTCKYTYVICDMYTCTKGRNIISGSRFWGGIEMCGEAQNRGKEACTAIIHPINEFYRQNRV